MDRPQLNILIAAVTEGARSSLRQRLLTNATHYSFLEAENGVRAIELHRQHKPDCVILEHGLPDFSTVEVIERLRTDDGALACGVVVIVGVGCTRVAVEAMKSGAHDCLENDRAQGEELRSAVSQAIEKARRRRSWARVAAVSYSDIAGNPKTSVQRNVTSPPRRDGEPGRNQPEFRSLFEASAVGATQTSPDGKYLRVNNRICQMLGYTVEELLKLTLHDVTHPEDRDVSAAMFSSSFAGKPEEYTIEKRFVRKDGSIIWGLINWEVICDTTGQPLHAIANVQDITARKHAEEALRASEAQLRAILDNSTAVIFIKDLEGRYLRINRWYEVVRGVTDAEAKGKTDYDLFPKEIADVVRSNDREVLAANTPLHFEEQVVLRDGLRHFISIKFPLYDNHGQPYAVCGIATDITERKQSEEALRTSEEQVRSLIEQASDGIFVANLDGIYTNVNRSACQMLGYTPEQLVGMRITDLIPAEDLPRLNAIREELSKGGAHLGEWRLKRMDGSYLQVELSANVFPDGRWTAIARDIQGRKQVESEREELLAREHAAREAAEAANRSKDEFLAVVSHELRSPLNAMLGYAQLLRYGPLDAQKVKHAIDVIERNGRAQSQLIEDLLDTARIISGKLRLEVGPLDLVHVIEEAVQTIYPAADAKSLSLEIGINLKAVQITGDPARLRQVVWNLLSNAVKFTPAGGRVEVRLERIDPHVCITVSDTGKGISVEFMPYVFDRFRQADTSIARKYGGLGLGLALVKYLVELHGGTIEAASAGIDKGATFKVLLPVRAVSSPLGEDGGAPSVDSVAPKPTTLTGIRVLIVDDDNDARELLKTALEWHGAEVVAATAAAEAYSLVADVSPQRRPDLIVADLEMPEEDGYSLRRRLRAWESEHGLYIPAVALTAYARSEDRVLALRAGFQIHIAKPVEPVELAAVIASLVKQQR